MKLIVTLCLTILSFLYAVAHAGDYTPEGLYDVTRHKLDNGLEIYLKERHEAKSTSIRLIVNYGSDDNECGKRETAHYLEHLLFTGTSKHTEKELDSLIEDNGGSWNATTSAEVTTYKIDIYSKYTGLALNTLHEIITDSTITEENVKTTLDIINREAGGKYSWFSRFLFTLDIGKTGYNKANEIIYSNEEYCPIIESFEDVTRNDILFALDKFYVPNNMALMLVGNFDSNNMLHLINNTFGKMESKQIDYARPSGDHSYNSPDVLTGTLNPLRGNDAEVYVRYRTPGYRENASLGLTFLSLYLTEELYNTIRINQGLSYSTGAGVSVGENHGTFSMYADSEIENMQTITDIMLTEVDKLIKEPIPTYKFESFKRGLLLSYVSSFQSNAMIADFYESLWPDLLNMNTLIQPDEFIEQVTPEDIHKLAVKYLKREKAVISHDHPTLTYEQTYILIGLLFILIIYAVRRRLIEHKQRQ
jgi:predicted Zn-dependent peptidase